MLSPPPAALAALTSVRAETMRSSASSAELMILAISVWVVELVHPLEEVRNERRAHVQE